MFDLSRKRNMNKKITIIVIFIFILIHYAVHYHGYCMPSKTIKQFKHCDNIVYENVIFDKYEGKKAIPLFSSFSNTIVLYLYGGVKNHSYKQYKINKIVEQGFSVYILDFSGFGRVKGSTVANNRYVDSEKFVKYISKKENIPIKDLVIYAECISACVAIHLSNIYDISRIVLESSCTSLADVLNNYTLPFAYIFSPILTDYNLYLEFDKIEKKKEYKNKEINILMIHSIMDEVIPFKNALSFKNKVTDFISISGSHGKPNVPWKKVSEFIKVNE